MAKLYWTYRRKFTNSGCVYDISYFLDKELQDYRNAGIMSVTDSEISDKRFTAELTPGNKSLTRFFVGDYNEAHVPAEQLQLIKDKLRIEFYALFFDTAEEARQRLRDNTDLEETETGTFKIQDAEPENYQEEAFITID